MFRTISPPSEFALTGVISQFRAVVGPPFSRRYGTVRVYTTVGIPRFRCAALGMTASLSPWAEPKAESKGLDIAELSPVQFNTVHADPIVGTPRFRCAALGVTAVLSCWAEGKARSRNIPTLRDIRHHESRGLSQIRPSGPLDKLGVTEK